MQSVLAKAFIFRHIVKFQVYRSLHSREIATKMIRCICIPGAKRGYYGFIIVRIRRDFLLATYSPHFFPDFCQIWQVA